MNETQSRAAAEPYIDIAEMLRMLLAKVHWLLLTGVAAAVAAYLITTLLIAPKYQSYVTMYVYNKPNDPTQQTQINTADLQAAESLAETYTLILKSNSVLDAVVKDIREVTGEEVSRAQVGMMTSASTVSGSQVLKVTVTSEDPELACHVAAAFGRTAPDEIVRVTKAGGAEIVDSAETAKAPSSPNIMKNTAVGFIAGFVAAAAFFVIKMLVDTTICIAEDIEKISDVTILGEVPSLEVSGETGKMWTMVQGGSISYGKKKEQA